MSMPSRPSTCSTYRKKENSGAKNTAVRPTVFEFHRTKAITLPMESESILATELQDLSRSMDYRVSQKLLLRGPVMMQVF